MAKAMLRMGGVFVSVTITFCSFAISAEKVPLAQCSRVRFSRVIPLVNQKRTFDERIRCITRHDVFRREVIGQFHCKLLLSPESAKAEVIVVEPVKRKKREFMVI